MTVSPHQQHQDSGSEPANWYLGSYPFLVTPVCFVIQQISSETCSDGIGIPPFSVILHHRFMQDLEDMLGFRPYSFYFYMWRYVSPAVLVVLIIATVIEMAVSPAGYNAWVEAEVSVSTYSLLTFCLSSHIFQFLHISRICWSVVLFTSSSSPC